jgi:class 3 adenylate cyclase/tetratricopeptide (TPR) repeat protein
VECRQCQRVNPPDSRFCNGCGAALELVCAGCGRTNPPDARFCNGCGGSLGAVADTPSEPAPEPAVRSAPRSYTPRHLADRILRTRSALEGERKHVTVLFCDLADSTSIAERLGAEAMHAVLDRCFTEILQEVHRYEGTVNQFLGDGVMALFGAPLALEDAPRRAVSAALGIQRVLGPIAEAARREHGVEWRMRIGIHAGLVVVGRIGDDLRMDYTAIGDTTNLAARLQGLAAPGTVLISEAVEHQVAGFFELRDLGVLGVRGRSEAVHAFEVLAERRVRGRIEAREEELTALVGREAELAVLESAFADARAGRGRVVFLVGEAGMGKSRLLYELRRRLHDEPHLWLEGQCASFARDTPFHVVADALRHAFGIDDRDSDDAALAKLDRGERERGGDLDWTLPYVRQLLSLPSGDEAVDRLDAATRRSETFRALGARFVRASERAPLVLVMEDVHWIDKASEEFLEFLTASVPTLRALFVLTHRPGYRHPFGDRSYHLRVTLQALSESEMDRMAGALLHAGGLPESLRRSIARKAEGNPFFVEEVTRSLLEEGVLRRVGERVELARDPSQVSIPDSIQDVLMARLDRLPDEPKRALQVASVIGREFALRLLERIHEAGARIRPMMEELRALELIYEKAMHPELAFMFKHALTHDVAYASVLEQRRRALHRIVGTAIEELYADRLAEHYEALAHHFTEGEAWEAALRYHARASAKAEVAYANQSAAHHCRQALAIAERLGEGAPALLQRELLERLGRVCFATSEFRAAGEAFERAAALAGEDADAGALDLARAGHAYVWGHDYDDVDRVSELGLSVAREHGSRDGAAYTLLVVSFHDMIRGRLEQSHARLEEALAREPGHPEVCAFATYFQGAEDELTGAYESAARHHARGEELARKHDLPIFLIQAVWFRGKALVSLGRYAEGLACFREALDVAERIGDRAMRARLLNTLGWLHSEVGDPAQAAAFNERSLEAGRELPELGLVVAAPEVLGNAAANLASDRIALGDLDGAEEALALVRSELTRPGDPWMRWRYGLHVQHAEARLALEREAPDRTLAAAEAEREGALRMGARKIEARAGELAARALLALERHEEADASCRAAFAVAESIGYPPVCWRALALRGTLLRHAGRRSEARASVARARALVDALADDTAEASLARALRGLGERLAGEAGV